jgi:hypothetical protein
MNHRRSAAAPHDTARPTRTTASRRGGVGTAAASADAPDTAADHRLRAAPGSVHAEYCGTGAQHGATAYAGCARHAGRNTEANKKSAADGASPGASMGCVAARCGAGAGGSAGEPGPGGGAPCRAPRSVGGGGSDASALLGRRRRVAPPQNAASPSLSVRARGAVARPREPPPRTLPSLAPLDSEPESSSGTSTTTGPAASEALGTYPAPLPSRAST